MEIILLLLIIVGLVCAIIVLIDAFRDETWKGILSIIFLPYLLWYTFTDFDHDRRGVIQAGFVLGCLANILLQVAMYRTRLFGHGFSSCRDQS